MDKILISACLLGDKTTYNGKDNYVKVVEELKKYYILVPFCPEVEGGLSCPRLPSEIKRGQVYMNDGTNVTRNFEDGAEKALNVCRFLGIRIAVLKENSPSCGTHKIHDGKFEGKLIDGMGITAALLKKNGIKVYSENEIEGLIIGIEAAKEEATLLRLEKQRLKEEAAAKKAEDERARQLAKEAREKAIAERKERKSYGERKPRGERKPFGDRKPFGERKSYSRKPYVKKEGEEASNGEKKEWKPRREGFKKSYGEEKPYGEKKSYGRKPGFRKPFKKKEDKSE